MHAHAVARAERDEALRLHRMAFLEAEPIALGDRRQDQHGLCHGERHADTDPRAGAARNVSEAMARGAALRRKALRIEAMRIVPDRRLSMQQPRRDDDSGSGRNAMAEY